MYGTRTPEGNRKVKPRKRTKRQILITWLIVIASILAVGSVVRFTFFTDASELKNVLRDINYEQYGEVRDVKGWFPLYDRISSQSLRIGVLYRVPEGKGIEISKRIANDMELLPGISCESNYSGTLWRCVSSDGLSIFTIHGDGEKRVIIYADSRRA